MQRPLFVYGTLKPGDVNYRAYLDGLMLMQRPASLRGAALYTQGPYPFLVYGDGLATPGESVDGALVLPRPEWYDRVLARIDDLEGYTPGGFANLYERIALEVESNGVAIEAWTYIAGAQTLALIRAGRMRKVLGNVWA